MPKKLLQGEVLRVRDNTAAVLVTREIHHPVYHKLVRRSKKYLAHDEIGVQVGDRVRIQETTPISKRKRFKIRDVITSVTS